MQTEACERLSCEMSTFCPSNARIQVNMPSIDLAITLIWAPIGGKILGQGRHAAR